VGIVPEEEVIGLSKFNRLVHHICERPQIQEEMTTQIASALRDYARTENIAVVVKAEHHCMTMRGVREHESDMTTAIMLGAFETDPALKKEFYDICLSMKGHGSTIPKMMVRYLKKLPKRFKSRHLSLRNLPKSKLRYLMFGPKNLGYT